MNSDSLTELLGGSSRNTDGLCYGAASGKLNCQVVNNENGTTLNEQVFSLVKMGGVCQSHQ